VKRPEEQQQTAFFDYCRAMAHVHKGYELAFAIPNERKASIARHVAMKRAGLTKGIPDICVPIANDKYSALYIEMKIKPNKASSEQMDILRKLNAAGNYAVICWSANEAIEIISKYLSNAI